VSSIDLNAYIRNIPDFPKPGIQFKDITPLLADAGALRATIEQLAAPYRNGSIERPDLVAAAEARGFIFAAPLAIELGIGFVPIRKPGKLPYRTVSEQYELEYGSNRLEMHSDAIEPGRRVLLIDDVLATGGTMRACCELVRQAGAEVMACAFVIELDFLEGRKTLEPFAIHSLLRYS
jgi:adenine phosphoribosyltransferase